MVGQVYEELEELQLQYAKALNTIAALERKLQKLQQENETLKQQLEALQRDHEELRRIMKYYKKKYEKLRDIIVRALSIEKEMGRELTLRDLKRQLTGELNGKRR
mgnify:CR=1 FL=1